MAKITLNPKQMMQMTYLVAKMKSEGESMEVIKNHLTSRGLPDEQVDAIMLQADAMEEKEVEAERKKSKQMMLVGICTILAGLAGLYLTYMYVNKDVGVYYIGAYLLTLFGLANIVYSVMNNPDRKAKREKAKGK